MARGNKGTNKSSGKFRSTERKQIRSTPKNEGENSGHTEADSDRYHPSDKQSDLPPSKRQQNEL